MNLQDYLIDPKGKDWSELLSDWHFLLPEEFTLWMVNRFGDLFIVTNDGAVHMLDVSGDRLNYLAASRDEFSDRIDVGQNANTWLMIPLVDRCVAAGMRLGPGQCYSYKIAPMLGGGWELDNIEPADLARHYSFLASIARQLKDVPDGGKIRIRIGPEPAA